LEDDLPEAETNRSLLDAAYCFPPLNAPVRHELQMPNPVPLPWMKLQTVVRAFNSE
jgi:hypothetical protein